MSNFLKIRLNSRFSLDNRSPTRPRSLPKAPKSLFPQWPHFSNQALQLMLRSGSIYGKLTVNPPNDKYEEEADRVALQVMHMPGPEVERQAGQEEEKAPIQTKPPTMQITPIEERQVKPEDVNENRFAAKPADGQMIQTGHYPETWIHSLRGSGRPLSQYESSFFEQRFGYDFSCVRLHFGAQAADSARAINAEAYTAGKDIVFGPGRYEPETNAGRQLLAHELVHVIQQDGCNILGARTGIQSTTVQRAARLPELISQHIPPSTTFKTDSLQDIWHPIAMEIQEAVERACEIVSRTPRSYEDDLYRVLLAENSSNEYKTEVTLNFFRQWFPGVFYLLDRAYRFELCEIGDPEREEVEFNSMIAIQVYDLNLFPVAEAYFIDNPDRLDEQHRRFRQRQTPSVGEGEALV
jgi:hypothetical protein